MDADPTVIEVFSAYRRFSALDRRFLPRDGGIDDQDCLLIEGIAALVNESKQILPPSQAVLAGLFS